MRTVKWMLLLALCGLPFAGGATPAQEQEAEKPYEPVSGQEGKDVVWVPTPHVLAERMLDMAAVTPRDYVMDLGSGDGRNVIAAAKRGARGLGVEYNPDMVALSRRLAAKEGVADKALFVQGDMFEADVSEATVLALFLLPANLARLTSKFVDMKPGSRIVANGFGIGGWEPDEASRMEGECVPWCSAFLYIVPAKVAGTWRMPQGTLTLSQNFQKVTGTLSAGGAKAPIKDGLLRGDRLHFTAGGTVYEAVVEGDVMRAANGAWKAERSAK